MSRKSLLQTYLSFHQTQIVSENIYASLWSGRFVDRREASEGKSLEGIFGFLL